jgi:uncharacterized protein
MDQQSRASHETLFGLADPLPVEGKTSGYVKIPHSSDMSGYGFIPVPIVVVANGVGPTALLMAGSQGDEYEGQVALARLARDLTPEQLVGRVVILPMANSPAARGGLRNSPIDGLNLNRTYPGDVRGRPTSMIASFIEHHLMTEADIVVDLHSGGRSLRFAPCATLIDHVDHKERSKRLSLAYAFGAPMVLLSKGFEERNSSGAAMRAGAVRIGAEIGGGETLERALVDLTYDGLVNVLSWAGILRQADPSSRPRSPTPVMEYAQVEDYVYSLAKGLFEAVVDFGDTVNAGDLAGYIHDPLYPLRPPVEVRFSVPGNVVCRRAPGPTDIGDCLIHLAREYREQVPGELALAWRSNWLSDLASRRKPRIQKPKMEKGKT